jgi:DNA-binding CsgD family transcriptional regulator/PAS domain-containing protein
MSMSGERSKSPISVPREMPAGADDGPFVRAVEAIYATALAPEQWPSALQAIADLFGDVGAVLSYRREDGRFGVIVSPRLGPGQEAYNREWYRHDIRAIRMIERGYLLSGDVATDSSLGIVEEHGRHPFFTDFLSRFGLRWFAAISICPDPDVEVVISLQRSAERDDYSDREAATLTRIARHAEQALRLGMRLIEAEAGSAGLRDTFARLNMGIVLLDGLGRIVFSNETAKRFLAGPLDASGERLMARSIADRPALQAMIDAALQTRSDRAVSTSPRPILLQTDRQTPVAVYVLPLRTSLAPAVEQFLVRSQAIALIVELKAGDPADPALVRDLLGLTLGEARVAALIAAGVSPRDAAQKLGIAEETARTVLKRVFIKSGISRQSELAALIAKAAMGNQ